jgi:hypothetical protein
MSVSPFSRARPQTLQEPSRIESTAGKSSGGGPTVGEMLEVALADISVKSMADVTAGVRATGAGKKGKGAGAPSMQTQAPMQTQQPGLQTQGTQNDSMAEKIRQAVERATSSVVATPVVATDAFDAGAASSSPSALSSFSDNASSTPAAQSNPDASVKAFALAPVRLRG